MAEFLKVKWKSSYNTIVQQEDYWIEHIREKHFYFSFFIYFTKSLQKYVKILLFQNYSLK